MTALRRHSSPDGMRTVLRKIRACHMGFAQDAGQRSQIRDVPANLGPVGPY